MNRYNFDDAYANHIKSDWDGVFIHVIEVHDLIRAKAAAARAHDLIDIELLRKLHNI